MVTTLCHFGGRSPLKKSSATKLNPASFTQSRHWNGNKIIYKHLYPDQMIQITKFFIKFFLNRMRECTLIYFVCDCYGHLWGQKSTWHPGKCDVHSVHPLYVPLPYHLFNIYFMKQWCLTKIQNDDCVCLCSLLGASYPTSFTKSMSTVALEIVFHFFLKRVLTLLLSIRQFASSWNKCNGLPKMSYLLIDYTHDTYISVFPVSDLFWPKFTW